MKKYKPQPHRLTLYLRPALYRALSRLQADKGLGWSYAGLYALVEGLYRLGYLSDHEYMVLSEKYSTPLRDPLLETSPTIPQSLPPFREALEEWPHRDPSWKRKWATIASKYPMIQEAKMILRKAEEEGILVEVRVEE